jgi:hypothetical protein
VKQLGLVRTGPSRESIKRVTYNDHGDKMEEIDTEEDLNQQGGEGGKTSDGQEAPHSRPESRVARISY